MRRSRPLRERLANFCPRIGDAPRLLLGDEVPAYARERWCWGVPRHPASVSGQREV